MARRWLSDEAVANLMESGSDRDFVPMTASEYEPSDTSASEEINSDQEEEPMETEPEPLPEPSTPSTLPQGTINMNQCSDVIDGESRTGQRSSLCILMPDKEYFIRAENKEIING
ncbi:Myosin phosphatase Rho-interacting protein [Acipenser ruthenus]|uniref:Myosin phosphatase Rho-interacting protein n=1 Tax=Acipenser ruthenus TaxID=7906 RepID=A0A444TYH2_ACIRT|nr:Myosin phosphatase Rho-interacting protein [Acipenser ruthenus]